MDPDSDDDENLSPEQQEVQNRLLQAFERVGTISMALDHVAHLLNPDNPYTPATNTPPVRALLDEVKPGKTVETRREAMLKLQEKLTVATKEYERATKEAEKLS
ncbi:hypothetical protein OG777_13745 [Micromonospora peucetia]|uniref:Uncharacterized protein n=1 Tax=Micromonospora peucetia TaxID=47871 RepID=A0A1C6VVV1_9ACTN|nr:hypothetical protein [Micromonospora peucetia]MCX4387992.1 hypothetical protein [Micromonospora peucetia]WSA31317.1 hypothetical protein OIE14_24740 [Micromonospora peucetia]SCL70426.1 hypothetical protein GA0070608_4332 [Micromonospora peucetia]